MMSKEWKGNKNAIRAAIVCKKPGSDTVREVDDFYAIDPKALEMLLDKCGQLLHFRFEACRPEYGYYIWEPACGNGNLAHLLRERGYSVIASDLKDRGYGSTGDFLKLSGDKSIDIILTNPPYSLATEFIEHALEILPENGLYIALMNISYLTGKNRYERVYRYGTLREIYVFSKRIECWKNNIPSGHSSMANYAWYIFQKGYKGNPTLYWL